MRRSSIVELVLIVVGITLVFLGASTWIEKCSEAAFDRVCFVYNPYPELIPLALAVMVLGLVGPVWFDTRPDIRLVNYWRACVSRRAKLVVLCTSLSLGFLGAVANWKHGGSAPYVENYWPWFLAGTVTGIIINLTFHRTIRNWKLYTTDPIGEA